MTIPKLVLPDTPLLPVAYPFTDLLKGGIWFNTELDAAIWLNVLAIPQSPVSGAPIVLCANGYEAQLVLLIGDADVQELLAFPLQFVYVPSNGFSERIFEQFATPAANRYFLRLFDRKELSRQEGFSKFRTLPLAEVEPFFAEQNRRSRELARHWLANTVVLMALWEFEQSYHSQMAPQPFHLDEVVEDHTRLASLAHLQQHLFWRLQRVQKQISAEIAELAAQVAPGTYAQRRLRGFDELISHRMQPTIDACRALSALLEQSDVLDLRDLGKAIRLYLEKPRPPLTLVGIFSSGKTTLLNLLLSMGQDPQSLRRFKTQQTANTAIVTQIQHVEPGAKERVSFTFADQIQHVLFTVDEKKVVALSRNIRQLWSKVSFIEWKDALTRIKLTFKGEGETSITIDDPRHVSTILDNLDLATSDTDSPRFALQNISDTLLILDHYGVSRAYPQHCILTAGILPEQWKRLPGMGDIPSEIDLTTDEGWKRYNPQSDQIPWDEDVSASFFVSRASVYLNKSLLTHTALADTPGLGSLYSRHGEVTRAYINKEYAASIVLLPTNKNETEILQDCLHFIKDVYSSSPVAKLKENILRKVIFVVNCIETESNQKVAEIQDRKRISSYQSMICTLFGISSEEWEQCQSRAETAIFFVVCLRNKNRPLNLYGYPSVGALIQRIRYLVRFGEGYARDIYQPIIDLLEKHWTFTLDQRLTEADLTERLWREQLTRQIQGIQCFLSSDTGPDTLNLTIQNAQRIAKEPQQAFESDCRAIANQLREIGEDIALKRADLLKRCQAIKAYIQSANDALDQWREWDPARWWADEVTEHLKKLGVPVPPLVSNAPKFTPFDLNRDLTTLTEGWTHGLKYGLDRIKGIFKFNKEKMGDLPIRRSSLANFSRTWDQQFFRLVGEMNQAEQQFQQFISQHRQEIINRCLQHSKTLQAAIRGGQPDRIKQLRREIDRYQLLDPQRRDVLARLTK